MPLASRVFFLEENGALKAIAWRAYERLCFGDPSAKFPEYAGKAVRGVHAVVEVENGVPVSIVEMNFFITYFGEDGGIDRDRNLEAQRLLARARRDSPRTHENTVIDITRELSLKRFERQFRWTPAGKEADRLEREIEALLGIAKR